MSSSAEAILLDGRYRLEERVGAGSMGAVWRATDERLNRVVAVKQLLVQPGAPGFDVRGPEYGDARQRILREGRLAARLQHPNTIGVYDVVLHDDVPWLVMEYLESRTLGALLAGEGPLEPRRAADIGSQAADGLAAAHAAGIVHRDIKPGNVLIGADGTVKITDFGVSRAADDVQLTRTGLIAGTPAFLAPEVARGQTPTPASDVFALGSTVYACVEGTPPFGLDDNAYAMLYTVGGGEIRIPTQAGQLTEALMWMLHKDPEQRPTAALAREELAAVAAGRHPRRPGRPVDAAAPTPTLVEMPVPATADEAPGPGDTQVDLAPPPSRLPAVPGVAAWRPPEPPPKPPRRPKPPRERATNRKVPLVAITAAGLAVLLIAVVFAVLRPVDRSAQQSGPPGAAAGPPPASTTPSVTGPSVTAPSVTGPSVTAPSVTAPSVTAPSVTAPSVTAPGSGQSSDGAGPPSGTGSSRTAGQPSSEQLQRFVKDYYALLPGDTNKAWDLLGPQARRESGSEDSYRSFYRGISRVSFADGPTAVDSRTVRASLLFETTDGATKGPESYKFTVEPGPDGGLVMSSFSH